MFVVFNDVTFVLSWSLATLYSVLQKTLLLLMVKVLM